jgi:hypothetical protein
VTGAASPVGATPPSAPPSTINIGGKSYNVTTNNGATGVWDGSNFFPIIQQSGVNAAAGNIATDTALSSSFLSPNVSGVSGGLYQPGGAANLGGGGAGNSAKANGDVGGTVLPGGGGTITEQNTGGGTTNATYGLQNGYYVPTSFSGSNQNLNGTNNDSWWSNSGIYDAGIAAVAALTAGSALGAMGGAGTAPVPAGSVATAGAGTTGAATVGTSSITDPSLLATSGGTGSTDVVSSMMNTPASAGGIFNYGTPTTVGGTDTVGSMMTSPASAGGIFNYPTAAGAGTASGTSATDILSNISNVIGSGSNAVSTIYGNNSGLINNAALLGTAALQANKINSNSQTYANEYKSLANPLGALAAPMGKSVASGTLQPYQQAQIDRMVASQTASNNQYLANAGISNSQGNANSTAGLDLQRQVDTNALIQSGTMIQQNLSNYLTTYGDYSKLMDSSIQAQITGDNQVMQMWDSVLGSMAKASAAGGSGGSGSSGSGGSSLSSIASFGSSLVNLGKSVWDLCDRRLKKDIVLFGTDESTGLNYYLFRYIWDRENEAPRIGPMADEVMEKYPWAVTVDDNGFYRVSKDLGAGHA